jgi:hypothetical protein
MLFIHYLHFLVWGKRNRDVSKTKGEKRTNIQRDKGQNKGRNKQEEKKETTKKSDTERKRVRQRR